MFVRRYLRVLPFLCVIFFFAACKQEIETIKVTPFEATLAVGTSQQFKAEGVDRLGKPVTVTNFTWNVSGDMGTVNSSGLFSATEKGSGQVLASYQLISGSAAVTVSQALHLIELSPSSTTVDAGSTQAFTAQGKDVHLNNMTIDPAPVWDVDPATLGTIGQSGLFTANGSALNGKVTATSGSVTGQASVTIKQTLSYVTAAATLYGESGAGTSIHAANGEKITLKAYGYDALGRLLGGASTPVFTWAVDSSAVGTVSATGTDTAVYTAGTSDGTDTLTATGTYLGTSKSGTVNIEVL